jgi:hypothetical protein
MNQVVVEGFLGGKLLVDEYRCATAFFCERFVTGCPCDVWLGAVVDELLALKPGEHFGRTIEGIDDIYAWDAPEALKLDHPEVVLYILSAYRHSINMLVVSQEKLREATNWAIMTV